MLIRGVLAHFSEKVPFWGLSIPRARVRIFPSNNALAVFMNNSCLGEVTDPARERLLTFYNQFGKSQGLIGKFSCFLVK